MFDEVYILFKFIIKFYGALFFRIRIKNTDVRVSIAEGTQKTIYCLHSRHVSLLDTFINLLTFLCDSDIYVSALHSVSFTFIAKILLFRCYRIATEGKAHDRDGCRLQAV